MKTNIKPFTLKDYQSGKYKVVTRDGKSVRIVCTDMKSYQPIIAIVRVSENEELYSSFSLKGELNENGETSIFDLFLKETVFEDGDIVISEDYFIAIVKGEYNPQSQVLLPHFVIAKNGYIHYNDEASLYNIRLATEEEKQKLFDALAKEGKRWNAEKKCIEDIKKEYQFKPFDRVLVRDDIEDLWEINFFSHKANKDEYGYRCLDCYYIYCIPYEGNEELLGTTNSPKQ